MTTIEDTFGERMTLTRAAEYIGIDRRQLKKVYRAFGGFDLGTGRLIFFKKGIDDAIHFRTGGKRTTATGAQPNARQ